MSNSLGRILMEHGPIRTVGVVGMGYVGIPSAVLFADTPCYSKVYGFQRDSPTGGYKIAMLNQGESPLRGEEPLLPEILRKVVEAERFVCTSDFSLIPKCDAVTLAIQTPFTNPKDLVPDFSPLEEALRQTAVTFVPACSSSSSRRLHPGRRRV